MENQVILNSLSTKMDNAILKFNSINSLNKFM